MGEEGFEIAIEVDRTFVTPQWDFWVVSAGHDECIYGTRDVVKEIFWASEESITG